MSTQEPPLRSSDAARFDFGKGTTSLDTYVAWIAAERHGVDYARAVGTEWEWSIAYACYESFQRSVDLLVMDDSAPLPRWLLEAVQGYAYPDTDTPAPSCFTSTTTLIDWFSLAQKHPDELVLTELSNPAPTAVQIESALKAAQARSAKTHLPITCLPPAEAGAAFKLRLDGLFVTPLPGDTDVRALIQRELDGASPFIVPSEPKILEWSWMTY